MGNTCTRQPYRINEDTPEAPTTPIRFLKPFYAISWKIGFTILAWLTLLPGCGGTYHPVKSLPENESYAVQSNFSDVEENVPEYQLGYGDVVEVKFFNNPEFNEIVKVRPDGRITLQRVGDVFVIGKTPAELREIIYQEYKKILVQPEVSIFVREFGGLSIYVLGYVEHPGGYQYQKNLNLLQAIALAGGPRQGAKMNSVFLLRKGRDGRIYAWKFDLKFQNISRTLKNNIYLEPYDIIYVPRTFIASSSEFFKQLFEGVLPPLDVYLRAVFFYKR